MKKLLPTLLLAFLLGAGLISSPAFSAGATPVALNDAVAMVQQRFNATAIKTETVRDGDKVVYRIRLVSADRSRVWTVTVDAQTGQVQ